MELAKLRRRVTGVGLLIGLVTLASGCGDRKGVTVNSSGGDSDGEAGSGDGDGDGDGDGGTGGDGDGDGDTGDGDGEECDGFCFVDFPCFGDQDICLDSTTIEEFETIWCDEGNFCPNACGCEGGSCESKGERQCDSGTLCVELGTPEHWNGGECILQEEACGGADAIACPDGQMCETRVDLCGPTDLLGRCVPVAPICDGEPDEPECGCDGNTYPNACERRLAGVDFADYGEC
jgi:hypothetical protein